MQLIEREGGIFIDCAGCFGVCSRCSGLLQACLVSPALNGCSTLYDFVPTLLRVPDTRRRERPRVWVPRTKRSLANPIRRALVFWCFSTQRFLIRNLPHRRPSPASAIKGSFGEL